MTVDHHTHAEELLFRALNAGGGPLLDRAAIILSARWFGVLVAVAIVAAIWALGRERRIPLLVAFATALVMSDLVGAHVLRPLIGRMRPCFALEPGSFRWLLPASDVGSLPSLHASNFFAMAVVARACARRLGAAAALVATAVALSRVYGGVHWPTDVLAGAVWGGLCGIVALALCSRIGRSGSRSRSPPD